MQKIALRCASKQGLLPQSRLCSSLSLFCCPPTSSSTLIRTSFCYCFVYLSFLYLNILHSTIWSPSSSVTNNQLRSLNPETVGGRSDLSRNLIESSGSFEEEERLTNGTLKAPLDRILVIWLTRRDTEHASLTLIG